MAALEKWRIQKHSHLPEAAWIKFMLMLDKIIPCRHDDRNDNLQDGRKLMEACKINDFLEILEPWLDRDYIRKVYFTDQDHLVFFFTDGGEKTYHIDDCTKAQLKNILVDIQKKGIAVEKAESL